MRPTISESIHSGGRCSVRCQQHRDSMQSRRLWRASRSFATRFGGHPRSRILWIVHISFVPGLSYISIFLLQGARQDHFGLHNCFPSFLGHFTLIEVLYHLHTTSVRMHRRQCSVLWTGQQLYCRWKAVQSYFRHVPDNWTRTLAQPSDYHVFTSIST